VYCFYHHPLVNLDAFALLVDMKKFCRLKNLYIYRLKIGSRFPDLFSNIFGNKSGMWNGWDCRWNEEGTANW